MIRTALAALLLAAPFAMAQDAPAPVDAPAPEEKPEPIRRPDAVDLHETYDMSDLRIPENEIHTLLPRDSIPALTDPKMENPADVGWLAPEDRVIVVTVEGETVASPMRLLNWHEVFNMTVGGEPVAVTYCPLCDSATVISRRVANTDGEERVLEFGVSGALYNSNVLIYDRSDMALWSQLGMRAVSGPMVGTALTHLPAKVMSWGAFLIEHPEARVVSVDTGYERPYDNPNPYEWFFNDPERLLVPVQGVGDALPPKTLGVGVASEEGEWFVPADLIGKGYTLKTEAGDVVMTTNDAGVFVTSAPESVRTAQTLYYSWSAFNPETVVVSE